MFSGKALQGNERVHQMGSKVEHVSRLKNLFTKIHILNVFADLRTHTGHSCTSLSTFHCNYYLKDLYITRLNFYVLFISWISILETRPTHPHSMNISYFVTLQQVFVVPFLEWWMEMWTERRKNPHLMTTIMFSNRVSVLTHLHGNKLIWAEF